MHEIMWCHEVITLWHHFCPNRVSAGVDLEAARKLGLRAVNLPGIPGKTAPVTAAKAIRDSIYNILHELGV